MAKIAFLGLGVMGFPMARHLVQDGNEVSVYNRTQAKAEKFTSQFNAKIAFSPAEASRGADIVFACVGADADLTEITTSKEGAFSTMKPQRLELKMEHLRLCVGAAKMTFTKHIR